MYKLRQRKAAATFRQLFYEETTGTNDLFNIYLLTCSKMLQSNHRKCAGHSQPRSQALSPSPWKESLGTRHAIHRKEKDGDWYIYL